jgi:hypothetical protein
VFIEDFDTFGTEAETESKQVSFYAAKYQAVRMIFKPHIEKADVKTRS